MIEQTAVQGSVVIAGGAILIGLAFWAIKSIIGHLMTHKLFIWLSKRRKKKLDKPDE